ncbi:hypothetical protein LC040_08365 [Bacillus tianshenii]|nr:hypothetical protein LC040_08365 [Bacillus tianshenii]
MFRILFVYLLSAVLLFPLTTAANENVISEKKSGDYYYRVTKVNEGTYKWNVQTGDTSLELEKNKENVSTLEGFRNTVNEIARHKFKIILYSVYLVLTLAVALYTAIKLKPKSKFVHIIILGICIYAVYEITQNSFDLANEIQKANFLMQSLNQ